MNLQARPPSTAWEPVPVPECPPCVVWAWFKPQEGPSDIIIQVPPETQSACGGGLTLRRVLQWLGIDAMNAESWTVGGTMYSVQGGANPLLDELLPPPEQLRQQGVTIRMLASPPPPAPSLPPGPQTHAAPMAAGPSDMRTLAAFNADWQALLTLETQLSAARKQLGALQGQLQSLNRDLSPDERLVADNQDKKDWQDARRWLRDSLATVSRYIRDHDIGMVSAAGNRNRFEQIYNEHVAPKKPFPGLASVHQEFEQHRKTAQTLLVQMQAAQQNAARDGVNRARQLLHRIAAKVRKSKEKRGTRSKESK